MKFSPWKMAQTTAVAALFSLPGLGAAITIDITDPAMTLSEAVEQAMADTGPDPAVINIHVNALTTPDKQLFIDKPLTINGDADGDGIPCDIIVDMVGIDLADDIGLNRKGYMEVRVNGDVSISDLRIHPNADGPFAGHPRAVQGLRMAKPELLGEVGNYTITNVQLSGSDGDNGDAFIPLDTGDDLYNMPNVKRWGGHTGSDGDHAGQGVIQLVNAGDGVAHIILDNCHAGLGQGAALNIPIEGGTVEVRGGVYGHCARDGIRVSGTGVQLLGTHEDRLRVVRTTNIGGANAHGIEVAAGGEIVLMEYVDVATCNTGNNFNFRGGGQVSEMRYCRALGKFGEDATNHALYMSGNTPVFMFDCTMHAGGTTPNPVGTGDNYPGAPIITNTIFTTEIIGWAVHIPTPEPFTLVNCALPTDAVENETLGDPPITGLAFQVQNISPIHESPVYALTLDDYDWSNNQGAGQPGNGPGNVNVLRPTNPNYLTAATDNNPLWGGAGAPASNIDPADWMLMQ